MAFTPMYSKMRRLLDALFTVADVQIRTPGTVAKVFYGYDDMPYLIPSRQFPYLCIDDGGEGATEESPFQMEKKTYLVKVELGVFMTTSETALKDLLDRWNTVMEVFWTYRKLTDGDGIITDNIRPLTVQSGLMFDKEGNPQFRVREAVFEFRTWQMRSEF